jgi:malate dehydrogenase
MRGAKAETRKGNLLMRSKVTIVGAGGVGASCAQRLAERDYADIVLVDIVEGLPQGKALDLMQCGPLLQYDSHLLGTNNYADTAESDIVIVTAGVARKPGMSRDDLVRTNARIVGGIVKEATTYSPNAILIMVTNPLDAMVWLALERSKFPRSRVLGESGVLDGARFRTFVAMELGVSVRDVSACIMGAHGDSMVPVLRLCNVGGIPLAELLSQEQIDQIVERAVNGGAEIVTMMGTSATYAPAASAIQMVDAILMDRKEILACAVRLEGEYGLSGVVGVPVKLGRSGMEEIVEVELTPKEREGLKKSVDAVEALIEVMESEE